MVKTYLKFKKIKDKNEWTAINKKNQVMGYIAYNNRKKLMFYVEPHPFDDDRSIWFSSDCLKQIQEFMEDINGKNT